MTCGHSLSSQEALTIIATDNYISLPGVQACFSSPLHRSTAPHFAPAAHTCTHTPMSKRTLTQLGMNVYGPQRVMGYCDGIQPTTMCAVCLCDDDVRHELG